MKKIIILVCLLMLGGCTTKFAYNNISWLVYWYLDDYVELNSAQENEFDIMLEGWMQWHKSEELPRYQLQLEDLVKDLQSNNINEQTITNHRNRARQHWVRARNYVAPDLVTLGVSLTPKQVNDLFINLEKQNIEDEAKFNKLDEQEKEKKWIKRNQKETKKWLGKLTIEEKHLISQFYDRFEPTKLQWLVYKREYQSKLQEVFALGQRDEIFKEQLHTLIVEPEKFRSQTFQNAMDANAQASSEYLVGLFMLLTEKQSKHLIEEINDLKQDIIELQE